MKNFPGRHAQEPSRSPGKNYEQDRLINRFVPEAAALTAAGLCGANRKTAACFFAVHARSSSLRPAPRARPCSMAGPGWKGTRVTPAATERESGPAARREKRRYPACRSGAARSTPLRQGHSRRLCNTLTPIMERKTGPGGAVYSGSRRGYNVFDASVFNHFRINHSELFADDANHVNGIENFWNQAKRRMRTSNGVRRPNSAYI